VSALSKGGIGALAGMGTAAVVAGAAITALGAAFYKSIQTLGEYGDQIKQVQERTGLTAQEVVRFSVIAQAAGTDIGTVSGMMRGLTQAVEGTGRQSLAVWDVRLSGGDAGGIDSGGSMTATEGAVQRGCVCHRPSAKQRCREWGRRIEDASVDKLAHFHGTFEADGNSGGMLRFEAAPLCSVCCGCKPLRRSEMAQVVKNWHSITKEADA
jgi:hypothetical protein